MFFLLQSEMECEVAVLASAGWRTDPRHEGHAVRAKGLQQSVFGLREKISL